IGHTPFGHSGEKALDAIVPGGFSHNKQSLRIVDKLARNGNGINLTWEVRDGILKHSKGRGEINIAMNKSEELPGTLEGKVVRIADIIAYINHDLDDAVRAGILKDNDIPSRFTRSLGETHSERIHAMVTDVVLETKLQDTKDIFLSAEMTEVLTELRDFLFDKVYESPTVQEGFDGAKKIIEELYFRFLEDDDLFYKEIGSVNNYSTRERIVCDFIAGMTDRYALELYKRVFLPRPWMRV
ncbi:MAG TPA: deoxyguanosinetriphosphate triphosphohydrolase, partial [Deltaproteobacteria bacterium]|nr:deoxyguanosinetriphosphate triphosphohydrolase [Deltaproteobacteria bacterium]